MSEQTLIHSPTVTSLARWRRPSTRYLALILITVAAAIGVLTYKVKPAFGTPQFWMVVDMRTSAVLTIIVVAFCQAVGTILFHTATNNRILTPSIMGFDALYVTMQTGMVFLLGSDSLARTDGLGKVIVQSVLMIGFATGLYGWLFSGRFANLHIMLLVGVILGMAFRALSTFMQRMLTPSDFDILRARLFGNLSNSNPAYLPWAGLVCVIVALLIWRKRHFLDVIALGREAATNLGLDYRREVLRLLILVAILISISTTLVGPMTFFGFIAATLAYQVAGSQRHGPVLITGMLLACAMLLVSYFILRHVFYAAGLITVIIEFIGGLMFLLLILRKGTL